MKEKMTLLELLESSQDKKILLLGREGIFTQKEIERFFKKYKVILTSDYEEGISAVIEHHMLNPVEEDISNMAYDDAVPLYKLKDLEILISESINDDELLMGIKLANDQSRVFRLLGNAHIGNELFVKLLSMYMWDDEDEDSREDRDVIMYTLRRYIDIKPNEEDLLYSYLTLRRLATEATDPNLMLALIGFPNFTFLVRGKEKVSLRETIARNEHIESSVIQKLISLRDNKVNTALASNRVVPLRVLENFAQTGDEALNKALATNTNISDSLFETLLGKAQSVVELLLVWQPVTLERLEKIEAQRLDSALFSLLGINEHLESGVVERLLETKSEALLEAMAQNPMIEPDILEKIYALHLPKTFAALAKNPASPKTVLETMYQENSEEITLLASLAYNASLSPVLLKKLFEKENFEINKGLATNPSLPMALLDILKVDTRLQNYLAENPIFIEDYETVLDYDKNAVQF